MCNCGNIKINHNWGFFSCCSVRYYKIVKHFNNCNCLPVIDSRETFKMYNPYDRDITFDFFNDYSNNLIIKPKKYMIDIMNFQFSDYKNIDYTYTTQFIKKYFDVSDKIRDKYNTLISKYKIIPEKCIGLYYRATDKIKETSIDSFESYYNKLINVVNNTDKNIQVILQTDSTQFLEYMKDKCISMNIIIIDENNTSVNKKGIHNENNKECNYKDIQYFFATILIFSKCKYIVCSSGNCSVWMMYYRGDALNVHQNLNLKWL
jgi:hypothetical protein